MKSIGQPGRDLYRVTPVLSRGASVLIFFGGGAILCMFGWFVCLGIFPRLIRRNVLFIGLLRERRGTEALISLVDLEGGYGGCNSKIKESNKTKQILTEDNPLEKEEERKSCMFV